MRSSVMPRLVIVTAICVVIGLGPILWAGTALALDYVDASPSGPEFPDWDGGDTVLRFADIDADGHVDCLTIGDHGSPYINTDQHGIMVYFGDGTGGWSIHMEGNFGYGGIAVGDVNNDGLLDVGYGMHHDYSSTDFGNQLIEVALGDGTGSTWAPWDDGLAANGEDWGMFATDFADVDHDGDLDLASNSFGCCNGVHVYQNNGDGTWTETWESTGGNANPFLCFGDVNGDGHPDLAASHQHGTIWLGDGSGGFTPADIGLPQAGSSGHAGVSLGDIDQDGCADLSFVQNGGVFVYLWRVDHWENGSNGLPATGDYDITYLWDMDVDGFNDVVGMADGEIVVWRGDGLGNWTAAGGSGPGAGNSSHALEVGGDIDHNGLPDIALVQEEGSWPSYQNHLYILKEASIPFERSVAVQFPRGNETFLVGSVQTIRWSAAHIGNEPALIDLDLSTQGPGGPWTALATGIPDSGHRQWSLPAVPTGQNYLRVTLRQGAESVSAVSRPFSIVPSDPAEISEDSPFSFASENAHLSIFPNPASGASHVTIDLLPGSIPGRNARHLVIHDAGGRLVGRFDLASETGRLNWGGTDHTGRPLPAGLYLLGLQDPAGRRIGNAGRIILLH